MMARTPQASSRADTRSAPDVAPSSARAVQLRRALGGLGSFAAQERALAPGADADPVQCDYGDEEEPGEGEPASEPVAADPDRGTRLNIAAEAGAGVGTIQARKLEDKDDDGKPARNGWRSLENVFAMGWPSFKDPALIRHPRGGMVPTGKRDANGEPERVWSDDVLPSWCGVYAIGMARSGGSPVGPWATGLAAPKLLRPADIPRVGDIVVRSSKNHHAMIVSVDADAEGKARRNDRGSIGIQTVDANAGAIGGEVTGPNASTVGAWDWGVWDIMKPK